MRCRTTSRPRRVAQDRAAAETSAPIRKSNLLPFACIAHDDLQSLRAYASQERVLGDERIQLQHMVEKNQLGRPASYQPCGTRLVGLRERI
jgi:hypothetical protein